MKQQSVVFLDFLLISEISHEQGPIETDKKKYSHNVEQKPVETFLQNSKRVDIVSY